MFEVFAVIFCIAVGCKFLALLGAAAFDWTTPDGTNCRVALVLMSGSALLLALVVLGARALAPYQWFVHVSDPMPEGRGFQEPCSRRGVLHHSTTDHEAGLRSNHKLHSPID